MLHIAMWAENLDQPKNPKNKGGLKFRHNK